MFKRDIFYVLQKRLGEKNPLIQVLSGPRQVGKTTIVEQLLHEITLPNHYASADGPGGRAQTWINEQWELAKLASQKNNSEFILVLDEVQKVPNWSESVKQCWDEGQRKKIPIKLVLLGSAPLLMQQGLTESLTGRFEVLPVTHWTWPEMREAFDWSLDEYCYFGAYPGAAKLREDEERWRQYVLNSLIEPTLAKDVLLMQQIKKPALLRQLFYLGCDYSSRILSYQKMLGQLDDAGNTVTLADYLKLLNAAGMLGGFEKFSQQQYKQRSSSPKLQAYNTALISAQSLKKFELARKNLTVWGRLIESTVGAYLINAVRDSNIQCFYWRERNQEVDFVLQQGEQIVAIEIKSTVKKNTTSGMAAFSKKYPRARLLQVGNQGLALEEFLSTKLLDFFN